MVEQFLNHIQRHELCKASDKILLAVSGGLDSVVMLELFVKARFNVGVAHCNFQLRGEESNEDELFVKEICAQLGLPFHTARFQTADLALSRKSSIQVTARELRYDFFDSVCKQYGYDIIATAHHLNDQFETVLMNLVRGTGMDGLTGIPVKGEKVIRPMLFASRKNILDYAQQNAIRWREDSSNSTDDYQRNVIRHHVVPKLLQINPNLEETFSNTYERINSTVALAKKALEEISANLADIDNERVVIDLKKLQQLPQPQAILWELIKRYGFNYEQSKLLMDNHQTGKFFESAEARITYDRGRLILEKKQIQATRSAVEVQIGQSEIDFISQKLSLKEVDAKDFILSKNSGIAQMDAEKVSFPIIWRHWQNGDTFIPLGMTSHKKISDLLIDEKVALPEKGAVTVLESDGKIIWVVGFRICDAVKVTDQTKKVLIIESLPL